MCCVSWGRKELDMTELNGLLYICTTTSLQAHDKFLTDEELLLTDGQRMWLLEIESTPGEDVVKTGEMTKNLAYDINLVDRAMARCARTNANIEGGSTVGKMLSKSIACHREIIHERKSQSMQQTWLSSCFKKLLQPPQPSALINQQPSVSQQDLPSAKR